MKIRLFVILIAFSLIFVIIPGSVKAMSCECEGPLDFNQAECNQIGLDLTDGKCIFSKVVQIQSKADCTQSVALDQAGLTGATAALVCVYTAEVGEACDIPGDCVSGFCENFFCADAPLDTSTSAGAGTGTFCECPAAAGSDCENVCKGSGIATGQTGRGCCCKKVNNEFQDCAAVANQAECDTKCKATGATADLGTAVSAIDTFLGQKVDGRTLESEMISGSVPQIIGDALKVFLGFVGSLALAIFIFGGIMWMTSGGNPERIKKAQATLVWSVLGMMVIFLSYVIVSMVISGLAHESSVIERLEEQRDQCIEQCKTKRTEADAKCEDEKDSELRQMCLDSAAVAERNCRTGCAQQYK